MKKGRKTKKRFFEKSLVTFVFLSVFAVFVLVMAGFVSRIANVEKNNPVLISEDFSFITFEGSYFYSVDEAPEHLSIVEMRWFDGARHEGESKLNQAFRDRYIYAMYKDSDGHRYIWVRDGDFYKENYTWAFWEKDYPYFNQFENSYFYKER